MSFCPKCGHDTSESDRFCARCGESLSEVVVTPDRSPSPSAPPKKGRAWKPIILMVALGQVIFIGAIVVFVGGKGCSSTEGSFVAAGGPLGDFTFTPTRCASGQRMNFFGVILVGDGPKDGGVLVIHDAVRGKLLKVEIPGSCKPPDYEICDVVEVTPEICRVFDTRIERTSTTVNDIRLLDGHARLDCAFPEGGTFRGDVTFTSCD